MYNFSDGQVHRLSVAEVTSPKRTANGQLDPPQSLAGCVVTWLDEQSDRYLLTDAVALLSLPMSLNKAASSMFSASPGIAVDVVYLDLDAEGDWELSNILLSGIIDVSSSIPTDFLLLRKKGLQISSTCPSNASDEF